MNTDLQAARRLVARRRGHRVLSLYLDLDPERFVTAPPQLLGIAPLVQRSGIESDFAGASAGCTLQQVTEALIELNERLQDAASRLRAGDVEAGATLELIEECARLASEASTEVDARARAALEPLPDLPGQLPLPAS